MLSILPLLFLFVSILVLEESQGNEKCTLTRAILVAIKCSREGSCRAAQAMISQMTRVVIISLASGMKRLSQRGKVTLLQGYCWLVRKLGQEIRCSVLHPESSPLHPMASQCCNYGTNCNISSVV